MNQSIGGIRAKVLVKYGKSLAGLMKYLANPGLILKLLKIVVNLEKHNPAYADSSYGLWYMLNVLGRLKLFELQVTMKVFNS